MVISVGWCKIWACGNLEREGGGGGGAGAAGSSLVGQVTPKISFFITTTPYQFNIKVDICGALFR